MAHLSQHEPDARCLRGPASQINEISLGDHLNSWKGETLTETKRTTKTKRTRTRRTRKLASDEHGEALARGLTGLLADTYLLYNTTQLYHWNVEGQNFAELHEMFEKQYLELAEAIDTIAERIRVLGYYTPGTLEHLLRLSRLSQRANVHDPDTMLAHLVEGHRQVTHRVIELRGLAEKSMDEPTLDLLVERQRRHEKIEWLLRSQAGQASRTLDLDSKIRAVSA
jgi:starvation-inducible DNA-binding protein